MFKHIPAIQIQTTDVPPSHVNLFRILTFSTPSLTFPHSSFPSSLLTTADGANTSASPVIRFRILLKSSGFPPLLLRCSSRMKICLHRTSNHSGLEKRWITVIEHRSMSRGEMVGSWVEIITRAP